LLQPLERPRQQLLELLEQRPELLEQRPELLEQRPELPELPELQEPARLVLQAQDHRVARALLRAVLQVLLRGVKEKLI
jgi:hypothetical protein